MHTYRFCAVGLKKSVLFNCFISPLDIMTTIAHIKEAILALKDRTGSSIVAINKWLENEKKVS